ncbi:tRNA wybutosine-synthesizing protein 3 homolog isoform X2 [Oryctolagus cuniculus]|uniref:tRNA wybutosine-synthesizing protein 3 homolog isoform X2 n=1 Tax=Oryctolagus cuniculus TaxID=9986 RepID=UPI0007EE454C|nr:tRNA wybutosine-synthesizing protein 3 homolog isoform X2 [Oryctolagus cuniculus]
MDRSAEFRRWKAQCLSRADLSRKGSVDEDAVEIVQLLNAQEQFFTTSSCAGRILLLDGIVALRKANGDAILKFEPFVLHVQCRQLRDAQILHAVAINSGFRNSGITVGKRGKTILAVRSTHGLEVPLSHNGKLMVTEEYVDFLLNIANQKMEENKKRIERFYSCLQHALKRETITNSQTEIKDPFDTHKKKRNQEKSHYKRITEDCDKELENDDADDPGINVTIFPEDY